MATKKKMLQAASGNATGGAGLNVEEVFSTYLYDGLGAAGGPQDIVNDINFSEEGGLFWAKGRDNTLDGHTLFDTERGIGSQLSSDTSDAELTYNTTYRVTSFNSDGVTLNGYGAARPNTKYTSWSFRKAPRFFDCVTWTGDGVAGKQIAHNLGVTPAVIITKRLDSGSFWYVYHHEAGANPETLYLQLQATSQTSSTYNAWNDTAPTSTHFTIGDAAGVNASGGTYVAYLFAHNDGDGEFGPDGDADIIKCGSYTGNGSTDGPEIDLGFEPQWFMWKRTDATANWVMIDTMRGISYGDPGDPGLFPNENYSENPDNSFNLTATGLKCQTNNSEINASGGNYIYIAIRRGTKVPESGTEVFDVNYNAASPGTSYSVDFPIDFNLAKSIYSSSSSFRATDRMRGFSDLNSSSSTRNLLLNSTAAEVEYYPVIYKVWNNTFSIGEVYGGSAARYYSWKRTPNFFDVVAYTGNGTVGRTVSHNLGVAPEMMWVKARDLSADDWAVYSEALGNTKHLRINGTDGAFTSTSIWNSTSPSGAEFTLGSNSEVNRNGNTYIAYLFASLDGVSKVGSYTGNGSSQTIDCGFTSGARFILIKRTDSTGDWYVWDTERGIVAGNDPHLSLNTTAAEVTSDDSIDPDSSGFIVNQVSATNINVSSASYIFYAIA